MIRSRSFCARRLASACIPVFASHALAQSDWSELYPMPRTEFVMQMFDATEASGLEAHIVMFGGLTDLGTGLSIGAPLGDTWIWSGGEWMLHKQENGPQRRNAAAMSRGPAETLLMFGGLNSGQVLNDTWVWNGAEWSFRLPVQSPSPRDLHAMAYEPGREVVVLFGGTTGSGTQLGDTWEWDGTAWSQIATQWSPPPREGHVMMHSDSDSTVYLHGGWVGAGYSADVYRYDSTVPRWYYVGQTSRAVGYHYGGYDPGTDRLVVGGGQYSGGNNTLGWLINTTNGAAQQFTGHAMASTLRTRYGMTGGNLDGSGHKFYLFKGRGTGDVRSTTEEFHSTMSSWSNSVLQRWNGPANGHGGSMVYDANRNKMVLVSGARYLDPAIGNVTHPCNMQDPPIGTRASNGWWSQGGGVACGSTVWVAPRTFDDFVADYSWGETFEFDPTASGVDRGWVRSDTPGDPTGGAMNAGAGLTLAHLATNGKTYRLGGYEVGIGAPANPAWGWLLTCVFQYNYNCMQVPVTRHIQRYRYTPLNTLTVDDDLYEYLGPQTTGPSWTRIASHPAGAIAFHSLHADPQQGRLVVFGGSRMPASSSTADLNVFDPGTSTWTTYSPPVTVPVTPWPTPRFGHRMVYDERRNVAVMFGGFDLSSAAGAVRSDTWELSWDPMASSWSWQEIDYTSTPGLRPGPRMLHSMVYDPVRQRVVVTGGIARPFLDTNSGTWPFRTKPTLTSYPQAYSDVWEWDGSTWELREPETLRIERFCAAAAWNPETEATMTFGGLTHAGILPNVITTRFEAVDDYGPEPLATTTKIGYSCPTVGNDIVAVAGQRPYVGTEFDISWSLPDATINYLPVVYIGLVQQTTNLGFVGLPSCNMFTDLNYPVTLAVNQSQYTLAIPDGPYGGLPLYMQVALFDSSNMQLKDVTDAIQLNLQLR